MITKQNAILECRFKCNIVENPDFVCIQCQKLLITPSFGNFRRCFTFQSQTVSMWLPQYHLVSEAGFIFVQF